MYCLVREFFSRERRIKVDSAGAFPASLKFSFTRSWENLHFSVEHDVSEREKFISGEQ